MANHRQQRINEDAKRILADVVRGLKDPRIPLMCTVTAVEITPDLKFAKVFVSIMGDAEVVKNAMKALESAAGFVRRELGHRMDLRHTPEIHFAVDHSIEKGTHIAKLLSEINKGDSND